MPTVDVVIKSSVSQSVRARQLSAIFDVPPEEHRRLAWHGQVPLDQREWHIGLIVGPSGVGKSTIASNLFPNALPDRMTWSGDSVLDDFPSTAAIQEITEACQAVGFNTIPAWLRPYRVLSTGEKFRVALARALIEAPDLAVVDEFTSVVDRQVGMIASYAVQKYVRRSARRFVAISCHDDIVPWLNPDWILEPATMQFAWRDLQPRPVISGRVERVTRALWPMFAPFHYLSADLSNAAQCYALFLEDRPVCFAGLLKRPHARTRNIWAISRVVTLPDYQGLGVAFALMDQIGAALRALRQRLHISTAQPMTIRSLARSRSWRCVRKPGFIAPSIGSGTIRAGGFGGRATASFEFIAPAMDDPALARRFLGIPSLSPKVRSAPGASPGS